MQNKEPEKDVEANQPAPIPISHFKKLADQGAINSYIQDAHYAGSGTDDDPYVVEWLEHDPVNPMEYRRRKKWFITMLVAFATLAVAFASSAYSGGIGEILVEFKVQQIIGILGVSLFVLGFAVGPLIWAPLSELFGRQKLFFITYALLTAFNAGATGSKNIETLLILRFFAGAFGSSPLTNAGGVIADMFPAAQRGLATSMFAAAPFLGPVLGPIVGGFTGQTIGWRWIMGVMAIFTGTLWIICSLCVPETYAPILLRQRAAKLSKVTGKVYRSRQDVQQGRVSASRAFKTALGRPWILLFREPIVFMLSLYNAIVYGTLYMLFAAFPIVFQRGRGWSPGIGGLAFLGVAVGMMGAVTYSIWDNKRYVRAIQASPTGFATPEARLPPAMLAAVCLPVGLFWFAWTDYPSIHWIVCIIGTAPFGFGMVVIFLAIMNYLIDTYVIYAASVLAANAVMRSLFGVAFPLFTPYMYAALGIHWASCIPAFLALACLPFPFIFYRYGAAIRKRCKFAAEAQAFLQKLRQGPPHGQEEDQDEDEDDGESTAAKTTGGTSDTTSHSGGTDAQKTTREEAHVAGGSEAQREAEALDFSFGAEEDQPEFAAIRTHMSDASGKGATAKRSRPSLSHSRTSGARSRPSLSHSRTSRTYEGSPFDIDRVNTNESFVGRGKRSPSTLPSSFVWDR